MASTVTQTADRLRRLVTHAGRGCRACRPKSRNVGAPTRNDGVGTTQTSRCTIGQFDALSTAASDGASREPIQDMMTKGQVNRVCDALMVPVAPAAAGETLRRVGVLHGVAI